MTTFLVATTYVVKTTVHDRCDGVRRVRVRVGGTRAFSSKTAAAHARSLVLSPRAPRSVEGMQPPTGPQPPYGPPPQAWQQPQPGYGAPPQPPPKKGMSTAFKVLMGLIGAVVLLFGSCAVCVGVGAKKAAENQAENQQASDRSKAFDDKLRRDDASPVLASKLMADYKANEVAADGTYKGKFWRVSGIVDSIDKTIGDQIVVRVGTGKPYEINSVMCFPSASLTSRAASLSKGASITATGRVDGMTVGSVSIHDCQF